MTELGAETGLVGERVYTTGEACLRNANLSTHFIFSCTQCLTTCRRKKTPCPQCLSLPATLSRNKLVPRLLTHHPSDTVIAGAAGKAPAPQVSHGQHKKGTASGCSQHGYVSTLDNSAEYEPLQTEKEIVKPQSKSDTVQKVTLSTEK